MPVLQFRTQQTEGSIRPDMWGFDGAEPRVFIENKFWAGLTDNQPVSYLRQLAEYAQPTVLLVIVPTAREQTVWRELNRRLDASNISISNKDISAGIVHSCTTEIGPIMALTSWTRLLSTLEIQVADDQGARSDLLQLRALCEAADSQAFLPISSEEVSDQRTPQFILQLGSIIQASTELAITDGSVNVKKLLPQASWDRIGRYLRFTDDSDVGAWFGIRFDLWRQHGETPLWLVFSPGVFGHALEVRAVLEPWAAKEGILSVFENGDVLIAINLMNGEEKDQVVRAIADRFKNINDALSKLSPRIMPLE